MFGYKTVLTLKYSVILLSSFYIVVVVWNAPQTLSSYDTSVRNQGINELKINHIYIGIVIVSVANAVLGSMAAFFLRYSPSMVSSVIKIILFILLFAQPIREQLIVIVLNALMTFSGFVFSYFLWLKSERMREAIGLLADSLD